MCASLKPDLLKLLSVLFKVIHCHAVECLYFESDCVTYKVFCVQYEMENFEVTMAVGVNNFQIFF